MLCGGLRWCFEDGARSGRLADIRARGAGTSVAAALYDLGVTNAVCRVEQRTEPALRTTRMRQQAEALARLVEPWLQRLDAELFR